MWQCFRLLPSRIVGVVIAKVIDCCHVWEYCHGGHGHMQVFCYGGCGNVLECCQMKFSFLLLKNVNQSTVLLLFCLKISRTSSKFTAESSGPQWQFLRADEGFSQ